MRRKILVSLNDNKEERINDIISENGLFRKINLTQDEIDYLFGVGYFEELNNKLGILVDLFEEEIICSEEVLLQLKKITKDFISKSDTENKHIFQEIYDLLNFAIDSNRCVYFIL